MRNRGKNFCNLGMIILSILSEITLKVKAVESIQVFPQFQPVNYLAAVCQITVIQIVFLLHFWTCKSSFISIIHVSIYILLRPALQQIQACIGGGLV